ncbi:hypothetical protein CDL15_Pgr000632 [Punica granatum]|uniref:Uncharacterized protein n=1 Tax=Punica granatum TaxID=22663 RepID=A0A218W4E9_PUNGR|nr:hypothetical protein CDL15_Pgr000632 [Punica granatum]PKI72221.1 hypothetical protein CRG98_007419 [Punica granatum]
MDGTGIASIIIGMVPVLFFVGVAIYNCLAGTIEEANDAAAVAASSDPHKGTKDGDMEVMVNPGEVVVEMATIINDVPRATESSTVGCCCGGGDGDGGGGGGGGGGCGRD